MIFRKCHGVLRKGSGPTLSQHMLRSGDYQQQDTCFISMTDSSDDDSSPLCTSHCSRPATWASSVSPHHSITVPRFTDLVREFSSEGM